MGEGARRADEGFYPRVLTARRFAPCAQTSSADPSSGAARHLLPQGEKGRRTAERYEVKPKLRGFARHLRTNATDEEEKLWHELGARRFADYKFRRQVPIGPYIADFVCHSAKLVIELDGSQHAESQRDIVRDAVIASHSYRILRIWNNELTHARNSVLEAIWHALNPQGEHP